MAIKEINGINVLVWIFHRACTRDLILNFSVEVELPLASVWHVAFARRA